MPDSLPVWNSVLSELKKKVLKQQFDTWFPNVTCLNIENGSLHLQVPNSFFRDWLQSHYLNIIKDSVRTVTGKDVEVLFTLSPDADDLEDFTPAPAPQRSQPPPYENNGAIKYPPPHIHDNTLRLHDLYTFDNFVVGQSNNLAHAAALAVAESPSQAYNPLFMHGSVGLGKTHLVQAIAHELLRKNPRPRIVYMSCENFMNEFISAVRHGDMETFRYRFRYVDVLLIDDIHFLGKGDRTQQEFFHTFNALYNDQKQIVITSDSPPKEIPAIEERLVSRFKWGLVTKISGPGYETRVAIIQKKAQLRGRELPDDVVHYIAENMAGNIREIEGAIIKIIGYAALLNKPIDLSISKDALTDTLEREKTTITIEDTQNVIIKHFRVKLSDLQSKRRSKAIAGPRQVGMYLARKLTDYSLEEIGGYFGGRDHTTVLHACDKIEKQLKIDAVQAATIEKLTEEIRKNSSKR